MDEKRVQEEQLSAMMDGELSEFEFRRLLRQIEDGADTPDPGLVLTWQRFHLIGAALRGEPLTRQGDDLAERVARAIADEPAPAAQTAPRRHPAWLKPLAGAAIAASVAVFTVIRLAPEQADEGMVMRLVEEPATVATTTPALPAARVGNAGIVPVASDGWRARTVGTHWQRQPGESAHIDQQRLNRYLLEHSEFEHQYGVGGFLPYASFIGYDPR